MIPNSNRLALCSIDQHPPTMKLLSLLALSVGFASAQDEMKPYHEMYNVQEPDVVAVEYVDAYDNDYPLTGYASIPETTPAPAVLIVVSSQ